MGFKTNPRQLPSPPIPHKYWIDHWRVAELKGISEGHARRRLADLGVTGVKFDHTEGHDRRFYMVRDVEKVWDQI